MAIYHHLSLKEPRNEGRTWPTVYQVYRSRQNASGIPKLYRRTRNRKRRVTKSMKMIYSSLRHYRSMTISKLRSCPNHLADPDVSSPCLLHPRLLKTKRICFLPGTSVDELNKINSRILSSNQVLSGSRRTGSRSKTSQLPRAVGDQMHHHLSVDESDSEAEWMWTWTPMIPNLGERSTQDGEGMARHTSQRKIVSRQLFIMGVLCADIQASSSPPCQTRILTNHHRARHLRADDTISTNQDLKASPYPLPFLHTFSQTSAIRSTFNHNAKREV